MLEQLVSLKACVTATVRVGSRHRVNVDSGLVQGYQNDVKVPQVIRYLRGISLWDVWTRQGEADMNDKPLVSRALCLNDGGKSFRQPQPHEIRSFWYCAGRFGTSRQARLGQSCSRWCWAFRLGAPTRVLREALGSARSSSGQW